MDATIKAMLFHLGTNMWCDRVPEYWWKDNEPEHMKRVAAADHLRCDEGVWRRLTARMAERKLNMLVIDLAEGLAYPSHPELAVKGSWSPEKMRDEIARLKAMGIEAIPKMNFSAGHDIWLGEYSRMLSTPDYYRVCADLIRDVDEIFGTPRFLHIGYDEEKPSNQTQFLFSCVRQGDLWWHDFNFFVEEIGKRGMRPWMWSDYGWHHEDFYSRCSKSVLQSNWWYDAAFALDQVPEKRRKRLVGFEKLEKAGFDQVPCGSNYTCDENIAGLVKYARGLIAPERLKGFLDAPWFYTIPEFAEKNLRAIDLMGEAVAGLE